ncbi:MAG TPA: 4Fe-4S dicluster domain-containing protein [bacterium (Candidatus Stahlbacteria)]|nr:4Fe-4S dicluster domain-containing protein [Candidatus Stahlbacteria bacterium]
MSNAKADIMEIIRESNKSVITGIDDKDVKHWVTIFIMGKAYKVPADLTIMQAMEYAGYRFIRGAGCRAGFCGACSTVYRMTGDYKLRTDLACQTRIEEGMFLVQIPFAPAEKAIYDINKLELNPQVLLEYYPEVARCVSCNTCTKACPQNLEVMDYVQAALRGDFKSLAELSFDCIQCGLCAIRCPAELVHYHLAQLGRRLYGRFGESRSEYLTKRLEEIKKGAYEEEFKRLTKMSKEELKELYNKRERETG